MNEIYVIIQVIGNYETVVDKAYWYYTEAQDKVTELEENYHRKGYVDFEFNVKTLELIGLK